MMTADKPIKIALLGNGPLQNRGCDAIVRGTVDILDPVFENVEFLLASFTDKDPLAQTLPDNFSIVDLPLYPKRFSLDWLLTKLFSYVGVNYGLRKFERYFKSVIDEIDLGLMIGGDGYAIEYGYDIVDRLMKMADMLKERQIPVVVWGASIGPFSENPTFEQKIMEHFKTLDLIVTREPTSYDYLWSHNVRQNLVMASDPAFALQPVSCDLPQDVEQKLSEGCIGLNLSPLIAKFATNNDLDQWQELSVSYLKRLLAEFPEPILLIYHVTSPQQNTLVDDYLFLQKVYAQLDASEQSRVSLIPNGLGSHQIKWIIFRVQMFIGARTHSTIAALSSCIPCLSLAYSRKAFGLNELIFDHTNWVVNTKEFQVDEAFEKAKELHQQLEEIRAYLNETIPPIQQDSFKPGEYVMQLAQGKNVSH